MALRRILRVRCDSELAAVEIHGRVITTGGLRHGAIADAEPQRVSGIVRGVECGADIERASGLVLREDEPAPSSGIIATIKAVHRAIPSDHPLRRTTAEYAQRQHARDGAAGGIGDGHIDAEGAGLAGCAADFQRAGAEAHACGHAGDAPGVRRVTTAGAEGRGLRVGTAKRGIRQRGGV